MPAASGAVECFFNVQARASFGPIVKKVIKPSKSKPFLMSLFKPDSSNFKSLRNSFFSSSSNNAISDSMDPEIITVSQFSLSALSNIFLVNLLPKEASFSLTLHTYKTGFEVNKLKVLIFF